MKFGLIYVGPLQEDQESILKNENSSPHYREFASSLAYPVSLQGHKGYLGKLEGSEKTGVDTPYFSNSSIELVFHEVI